MITIEILESPDYDCLGKRTYYRHLLTIGRNGCLINIEDELRAHHLDLIVTEQGLKCSSGHEVEMLKVNGKSFRGTKKIKEGDLIEIAKTKIRINNFIFDQQLSFEEKIKSNIDHLIQTESPINDLLDILEDEISKAKS